MPFALLSPDSPAGGPDLTRYLVVCALLIGGLMLLAWLFKRLLAGHLQARAAKRSLRVLDVLPLSGKQKLVVVRCYDRSFLLGLGEKEVRAIAELDLDHQPAAEPARDFASVLDEGTVVPHVPGVTREQGAGTPAEGVLA